MDDPSPDPMLVQSRGARVAKTLLWIGTIWLMGWIGMILHGAISWSNTLEGATSGAIQGAIVSPFLLIITLPAAFLGRLIGALRPLRKWRLGISLLFAALLPLWELGSALVDRVQPGRRFTKLTAVAFPKDAKMISCDFQGGGFADLTYSYVFTCPPGETERLIRELKLTKDRASPTSLGWTSGGAAMSGGRGPTEEVWSWATDYRGSPVRRGGPHYIELQTEETHTKVRLICGTI
ncbi:hypothetical protein [Haloferula sp. BvORR071]|uniref:hypothetical protein n=1 Tax=Haloferula sp. BvORR071 TaxID=1396141 RepID=UPI002240ED81|nr:hypothetical protein [Haloferula sp. BvORR071]